MAVNFATTRNSGAFVAATMAMMVASPSAASAYDGFYSRSTNTSPSRKILLYRTSPEVSIQKVLSASQQPTAVGILALVQNTFGLRVTQLADVFQVSRRSIYDWLGGKEPSRDDNIERLNKIHEILLLCKSIGATDSASIGRLAKRPIVADKSLLDLLSEPTLDAASIQSAYTQINEEIAKLNSRIAASRTLVNPKGQLSNDEIAAELDRLAG